jgi:dTMP kinase
MSALYIAFEGIDGCGKTTVSAAVTAALRDLGVSVAHLTQPSNISRAGQLIREIFDGRVKFAPKAMIWLFAAELADLEPRIAEMRSDDVTVVSDRHTMFSAFVYQVPIHGRHVVEATLRAIKPATPTHTYLIDTPAEVALERQGKRDKAHCALYEPRDVEKLDQLAQRYRNLPGWLEPPTFWPRDIKILDGLRPIQENVQLVLDDLELGDDHD